MIRGTAAERWELGCVRACVTAWGGVGVWVCAPAAPPSVLDGSCSPHARPLSRTQTPHTAVITWPCAVHFHFHFAAAVSAPAQLLISTGRVARCIGWAKHCGRVCAAMHCALCTALCTLHCAAAAVTFFYLFFAACPWTCLCICPSVALYI